MIKAVELNSKGNILRGMLHKPDNCNHKIPVVCMFHGYTSNRSEQHFLFVTLSKRLEKMGIASLRFDFSGSGESDGEFENMTLLKELDDAKEILRFAESLSFVDSSKIGVLGLSMGGAVASMLGGEYGEKIAALCLWAPAANIGDICVEKREVAIVNEKEHYVDIGGLKLSFNFIEEAQSLDIVGRAAAYGKEVLLIHGGADDLVPIAVSHNYVKAYGKRATLLEISGAGHTFDSLDFSEQVFAATTEYFVKQLK